MAFVVNRLICVVYSSIQNIRQRPYFDTRKTRGCATPYLQPKPLLKIILTFALSSILAYPAAAMAEPTKIRYAFPDQLILSTEIDKHGVANNPLLRVTEELFKRARIDMESRAYPAARMFRNLKKGLANFSILVHSPSLDSCCLIGKTRVSTTELRIYYKKGVEAITLIEDLAGKTIITVRGYSYGPLKSFIADPNNKVSTSPSISHTSAFTMLSKGRAKYLLDYKQPSIEVLTQNPIGDIQFKTLDTIDFYLVLSRDYPNAPQVLLKLENIIKEMDVEKIMDLSLEPESL